MASKNTEAPKRKKRGKAGKGSAFERKIAKTLSSWLMDWKETEPLIWRSSNSGGNFTRNRMLNNAAQKAMASDLISIDERSKWFMDKFSIECKNGYRSANICQNLSDCKGNILLSFWQQASRDAELSNRQPILVFHQLGTTDTLVGFSDELAQQLFTKYYVSHPYTIVKFKDTSLKPLILFQFDQFFKFYSSEQIKELVEDKMNVLTFWKSKV